MNGRGSGIMNVLESFSLKGKVGDGDGDGEDGELFLGAGGRAA